MVSDMQNDIAKAILKNADGIIDAIDRYLAKADDDLEKNLKEEGYAEPKGTVATVNSLEEEIADILHSQTDEILETLQEADNEGADMDEVRRRISAFLETDVIADEIEDSSLAMYEFQVPQLATVYMEETDGELVIETVRERTSSWIRSWSQQLGELTRITTHEQISKLIEDTISEGLSIADLTRKIQEGGWRNEYYQARRFALTETLRAHSVAHEEAIQQSPACGDKEWRHTGGAKNKPRPNHVAMDGQIVPKNEPFTLVGRDGVTYYPMYPRDSILPASETVNCHCIHRGIPNKNVLGLSYDERKKMQDDFISADNDAWRKELDASNRAKAGIEVDESEDSKPKYDNLAAVIDRKAIASADYRKRYDALPETKKVQRRVAANARRMLRHRSGTEYEDLAYIDSKTGSFMVRDDYNVKKKVIPSRAMKKMVKSADDYTIIAVHNHPTSSVPSLSDLLSARDKKYKYGIIAGHDGTIYKYAVPGALNEPMADGGLDLLERVKYISDEEERSTLLERALGTLKESGVEMEVL